jgi:DNA repair protein RadC
MLKKLPMKERPRERLVHAGIDALTISELLAIVLGSGLSGKSVLSVSEDLISRFGSLESLFDASIAELMEIRGIGHAKAIQLKAVFGIAQRWKSGSVSLRSRLHSPAEAYQFARDVLAHAKQEIMLTLLRDVKGMMIHCESIAVGTLTQILTHPREVFYPAIKHKAHSLILVHNHVSGDPTPSRSDLCLTRALLRSSEVLAIPLDDHVIVGESSYTSFYERGFFQKRLRY